MRGTSAFLLTLAAVVRAQGAEPSVARTFRFEYANLGADRCPSEPAVRSLVTGRLGYDPFRPAAMPLIRLEVERKGATLVASLRYRDAAGKDYVRTLTSAARDCSELASAMTLAVAVIIEPLGPRATDKPEVTGPAPEAGGATPASALLPAGKRPAPPTPAPEVTEGSLRPFVGGAVLLSLGLAPKPAPDLRMHLGLRGLTWSLAVEGDAALPVEKANPKGGYADVSSLRAALVPCGLIRPLFFCGAASVGVLRASGHGLDGTQVTSVPLSTVGGRVGAFVGLGSGFRITATVEAAAMLTRGTLLMTGESLWETPPVVGSLGAGVEYTFE